MTRKQRPLRGIPARGSKAVTNGKPPTPIEAAIDAAAERAKPMQVTVVVSKHPVRLKPDGRLKIAQGGKATEAQLLVRGPDGLWHGVLMPPGSTFELTAAAPSTPIWLPPGTKR